MRNLLSINAYHYNRGGADNVYLDHAELMAKRGWRASFFSMHHEENLPSEDEKYFVKEIDYAKPGSALERAAQAAKIIYSLEARRNIGRLLKDKPIDIAHVHSIYHHQSPSILLELKARGVPTVLTAHDLKLACPAYTMLSSSGVCERCKGGRLWNVAVNKCIKGSFAASALIMAESMIHQYLGMYVKNIDYIIAPSKFYREKLTEWGIPAEQVIHIPNFVPAPQAISPAIGGEYILYFGRLSKEKGLETLIRAAARARVPVRIAGRGPQAEELNALAQSLNAPVHFDGFQTGSSLWALVSGARAVVLPSEWYENGPLSAIEAFYRGKPLIGARIGGIPELIAEGDTGWSFASGDVEELANLLVHASSLTNVELSRMANTCIQFAQEKHSPEKYSESMNAIYESILR